MDNSRRTSQFAFDLVRRVGTGASADVWLATHRMSGRDVALKVFSVARRNRTDVEDFLRETRLVARAAHENILEVYGYGRSVHEVRHDSKVVITPGQLYLVSEYVEGGSLKPKLGTLDWVDIQSILMGLLNGLARLHARGIVHLDLKPANILCSPRGPLICDFGIATPKGDMSDIGRFETGLYGTPAYMAPEQGLGKEHLFGPWTDLYALGCMTVALVTGTAPYRRSSLIETIMAHQQADIPSLEAHWPVPIGFDRWLRQLMSKSWLARFHRASDAAFALSALEVKDGPKMSGAVIGPSHQDDQTLTMLDETSVGRQSMLDDASLSDSSENVNGTLPNADIARIPSELTTGTVWRPSWVVGVGQELAAFEDGRLVGRNNEQAHLWARYVDAVRQQSPCLTILEADSGLGKTSLCDWLATQVHEIGQGEVIWTNHEAIMGPHSGLNLALRSLLGCFGLERNRFKKRMAERLAWSIADPRLDSLAQIFESTSVKDAGDTVSMEVILSEQERRAALKSLLEYVSSKRPCLVIVDDAQWAFDTLSFLSAWVADSLRMPVYIVAAVRSDASDVDVRATNCLAELQQNVPASHLHLNPLSVAESARLLQDRAALHADEAVSLSHQANGNPLVLKALLFSYKNADESGSRSIVHAELSELLRRRFELWVQTVSDALINALQVLAVMGKTVERQAWVRVMGVLGYDAKFRILEPAIQGHLLEVGSMGELRFSHGTFVDALLNTLKASGELQRVNYEVARDLDATGSSDHVRIANHFRLADEHELAAARWRTAAEHFRLRSDYPNLRWAVLESARSLRSARIPRMDFRWLELAVTWTFVLRITGEIAAAKRRANRLWRSLQASGYSVLKARVQRELGRMVFAEGSARDAVPYMVEAAHWAQQSDDSVIQVYFLLECAELFVETNRVDECETYLDLAAPLVNEVSREHRSRASSMLHSHRSRLAEISGDVERALVHARLALSAIADSPSRYHRGMVCNGMGELFRRSDRFEEAQKVYKEAFDIFTAIGTSDRSYPLLNMVLIKFSQERFEQSLPLITELVASTRRAGRLIQVIAQALWGIAHLHLGRADIFDEYALFVEELANPQWAEADMIDVLVQALRHCAFVGDAERGELVYGVAQLYIDRLGRHEQWPDMAFLRAQL